MLSRRELLLGGLALVAALGLLVLAMPPPGPVQVGHGPAPLPTRPGHRPTAPLPEGPGIAAAPGVRAADLDLLGFLWYTDNTAAGSDLPAHTRLRVLGPDEIRYDTSLTLLVQAHPGRWWQVESGPTAPGMAPPDARDYARTFARAAAAIHAADPTAGVLPVAIAQGDTRWAAAFRAAVLAETGAPPDLDGWAITNWMSDEPDPYDFGTWRKRIESFRAWMAANGEGDRPLVLSRFGELAGAGCCDQSLDTQGRALDWMGVALRWLAAGNGVQAWAWFPLDPATRARWNGGLLRRQAPGTLSPFGTLYRDYAASYAQK
jgi:hypothetical protein